MQQPDQAPVAHRFWVTVWQEWGDVETPASWRFRLEDPRTHYTRVFASPQGLIVALKEAALDSEPGALEQQRA